MHKLQICHRDIKAENILVDSDYNIKIIDFELGIRLISEDSLHTTRCGTLRYISPEILEGVKISPKENDVWAFGVLALFLATGKYPFIGGKCFLLAYCLGTTKDIKSSIKQIKIEDDVTNNLKDTFKFLLKIFVKAPRIKFQEIKGYLETDN